MLVTRDIRIGVPLNDFDIKISSFLISFFAFYLFFYEYISLRVRYTWSEKVDILVNCIN